MKFHITFNHIKGFNADKSDMLKVVRYNTIVRAIVSYLLTFAGRGAGDV